MSTYEKKRHERGQWITGLADLPNVGDVFAFLAMGAACVAITVGLALFVSVVGFDWRPEWLVAIWAW